MAILQLMPIIEADVPKVVSVASVALIDADNRILLSKRPSGKAMAGLWEFPGGKLEENETPEDCLIRELHEELGITTFKTCLAPFTFTSHSYEHFHLVMFLFLCRKWEGTLHNVEGQAFKWVRPLELKNYSMPPANLSIVAMLRDFL